MTRVLIMSVAVWVGAAASWPATGASLSGQILMEDGSPYYVPVTATVASGHPVRERQVFVLDEMLPERHRIPRESGHGRVRTAAITGAYVAVMLAVKKINRWKVANLNTLDKDSKQRLDLRFRLDLSQLPQALQFGGQANSEWNIGFSHTLRLDDLAK